MSAQQALKFGSLFASSLQVLERSSFFLMEQLSALADAESPLSKLVLKDENNWAANARSDKYATLCSLFP